MASSQQYESQKYGDTHQHLLQGYILSVTSKAHPNLALGIRDNIPQLYKCDSNDPKQSWLKVAKVINNVRVFVLVSTATGQALCSAGQEVLLTDNKVLLPEDKVDESVFSLPGVVWGESEKSGYMHISTENLNSGCTNKSFWNAEGGVQGIRIMLRQWSKQETELWKMQGQIVTVCCKAYPNQTLGIKHGSGNDNVELVHWVEQWEKLGVEFKHEVEVFVLVKNGKALAHNDVPGQRVYMDDYKHDEDVPKKEILWTSAIIHNNVFKHISTPILNLDVNKCCDSTKVVVNVPNPNESQLWKVKPDK